MLVKEEPQDPGGPARSDPEKERRPTDDATGRQKIRCPQCNWHHDWKAHWGCELCDAIFDTFVTRAHCPNKTCGNSWTLTWCPRCHQPSPHVDWYVAEPRAN